MLIATLRLIIAEGILWCTVSQPSVCWVLLFIHRTVSVFTENTQACDSTTSMTKKQTQPAQYAWLSDDLLAPPLGLQVMLVVLVGSGCATGLSHIKLLPCQLWRTHLQVSTVSGYCQPSFGGESFVFYYQLPEAAIGNLPRCQPQVKGPNISSTWADETVLTLSWKGPNSSHRLQSEGRSFCHNRNPDVAIQAATHSSSASALFAWCASSRRPGYARLEPLISVVKGLILLMIWAPWRPEAFFFRFLMKSITVYKPADKSNVRGSQFSPNWAVLSIKALVAFLHFTISEGAGKCCSA